MKWRVGVYCLWGIDHFSCRFKLFQSIEQQCPTGTIFPPNGGSQCVPGDR